MFDANGKMTEAAFLDLEHSAVGLGKHIQTVADTAEKVAKKERYDGISLLAKNENISKFYEKLDYRKVFDKVLLGERIIKMAKCV